jgi:CRP-like cAMP-binding protein
MAIEINLKRLEKVPFLHTNFSKEFLIQMSKHFKERKFGPEEIIFQQGKPADSFYILISGQVSKIITLQNKLHKHIEVLDKDSAVFGHLDFFLARCHQTTVKST